MTKFTPEELVAMHASAAQGEVNALKKQFAELGDATVKLGLQVVKLNQKIAELELDWAGQTAALKAMAARPEMLHDLPPEVYAKLQGILEEGLDDV